MDFWTEAEYEAVRSVRNFSDLVPIALTVARRIPRPAAEMCGPISTGGLGSREANLEVFRQAIEVLQGRGVNIFSQMPIEGVIGRMAQEWREQGNIGYCMSILEELYRPFFAEGVIHVGYFLPGWESSTGTRWEYAELQKLSIPTVILEEGWEQNPNSHLF